MTLLFHGILSLTAQTEEHLPLNWAQPRRAAAAGGGGAGSRLRGKCTQARAIWYILFVNVCNADAMGLCCFASVKGSSGKCQENFKHLSISDKRRGNTARLFQRSSACFVDSIVVCAAIPCSSTGPQSDRPARVMRVAVHLSSLIASLSKVNVSPLLLHSSSSSFPVRLISPPSNVSRNKAQPQRHVVATLAAERMLGFFFAFCCYKTSFFRV